MVIIESLLLADRDDVGLGTLICVPERGIDVLGGNGGVWLPPFATPSI